MPYYLIVKPEKPLMNADLFWVSLPAGKYSIFIAKSIYMEVQLADSEQSSDQDETGFFLSVDLFEQLMISLAGAYSQLLNLEQKQPNPDTAFIEKYLRRHDEVLLLKESFPISAITSRSRAAEVFIKELIQSRVTIQCYLENAQ